jgi:hypothetical protein
MYTDTNNLFVPNVLSTWKEWPLVLVITLSQVSLVLKVLNISNGTNLTQMHLT